MLSCINTEYSILLSLHLVSRGIYLRARATQFNRLIKKISGTKYHAEIRTQETIATVPKSHFKLRAIHDDEDLERSCFPTVAEGRGGGGEGNARSSRPATKQTKTSRMPSFPNNSKCCRCLFPHRSTVISQIFIVQCTHSCHAKRVNPLHFLLYHMNRVQHT